MLLIGMASGVRITLDLTNWFSRSIGISDPRFNSIAAGPGVFIGSTQKTTHYRSVDTVTWNAISALEGYVIKKVRFTNGLFFALGWKGFDPGINSCAILKSEDGLSWTDCSPAGGTKVSPGAIRDIAYKSGMYIAPAELGIYYSTDLVNWTLVPQTNTCCSAYANDDVFIVGEYATAAGFKILKSSNGIAWSEILVEARSSDLPLTMIYYKFGRFFAVAEDKFYASDDNGETWSIIPTVRGREISYLPSINVLIVTGAIRTYYMSSNGISFTAFVDPDKSYVSSNAFVAYDQETTKNQNAINTTFPITSVLSSVESLANQSLTGFTRTRQAYASSIINSKIPSLLKECENQLRRAHTSLTTTCTIFGMSSPSAFPSIPSTIYDAMVTLENIYNILSRINFSTATPPSDERTTALLEAVSLRLGESFTAYQEASTKIESLLSQFHPLLPY